jgi:hypothetical protein
MKKIILALTPALLLAACAKDEFPQTALGEPVEIVESPPLPWS